MGKGGEKGEVTAWGVGCVCRHLFVHFMELAKDLKCLCVGGVDAEVGGGEGVSPRRKRFLLSCSWSLA